MMQVNLTPTGKTIMRFTLDTTPNREHTVARRLNRAERVQEIRKRQKAAGQRPRYAAHPEK